MTDIHTCVVCTGTVAPDGRCWDCGKAQPAFRARVELTADDGAAGVSDRGRHREINADFMVLTAAGPWTIGVVCDGVSMSPRADRAAHLAAEVGAAATAARLARGDLPETALHDATVQAGRAVSALAASAEAAPACTYVAGVAGPEGVWAAWVGDSRAYWLPDEGTPMALTEDDTGELEVLAAWLGADAGEPEPRVRGYRPRGPGLLLLCTDGLWRHLPDAEGLRNALARSRSTPLDGARSLVAHALDAGGQDNITVVLVPVRGRPEIEREAALGTGVRRGVPADA